MRKQRNIVVLGFSLVGKTSLCTRFCDDQFSEEYLPTYESTYLTSVRHRNEEIDMRITDTQGQDDQDLFRNEYCLGTHGYVLVYSVNSHRSLEKLKSLNTKLINLMGTENVPRVLVGNKIDMDDDGERRVSTAEGQKLAQLWGCPFQECSAKSDEGVDRVFHTLLDEIDRSQNDFVEDTTASTCCCFPWSSSSRSTKFGASSLPSDHSMQSDQTLAALGRDKSSPNPVSTVELVVYLRFILYVLLSLLLLMGLVWLGLGLWYVVDVSAGSDSQTLTYVLCVFGPLLASLSVFGLTGMRRSRASWLRTFATFVSLLLFCEVLIYFVLFGHVPALKSHSTAVAVVSAAAAVLQLCSATLVCYYQSIIAVEVDVDIESHGATVYTAMPTHADTINSW